jgi:hypothetical protein
MTTFSAIAIVENFEFIVKRTSIVALAIESSMDRRIVVPHPRFKTNKKKAIQ